MFASPWCQDPVRRRRCTRDRDGSRDSWVYIFLVVQKKQLQYIFASLRTQDRVRRGRRDSDGDPSRVSWIFLWPCQSSSYFHRRGLRIGFAVDTAVQMVIDPEFLGSICVCSKLYTYIANIHTAFIWSP